MHIIWYENRPCLILRWYQTWAIFLYVIFFLMSILLNISFPLSLNLCIPSVSNSKNISMGSMFGVACVILISSG